MKIRGDQLARARRRLRRADHRRAVGDALLRSRVADGRRPSRRYRGLRRRAVLASSAAGAGVHAMTRPRAGRAAPGTKRAATSPSSSRSRTAAIWRRSRAGAYQGIAAGPLRRVRARRAMSGRPAAVAGRAAAGSIRPTAASTSRSARAAGPARAGCRSKRRTRTGRWVVVVAGPGLPGRQEQDDPDRPAASRPASARARLRLRTNLEVYWDSLGAGRRASSAPLRDDAAASRRAPSCATAASRRRPRPRGERRRCRVYDRIANVGAALARPDRLLHAVRRRAASCSAGVDDRYVIMNAGDELQLSFAAPPAPPPGWTPRFRADRRRLGEGRRLQHRLLEDRAAAAVARPARTTAARRDAVELEDDPVYSAIARTGRRITRGTSRRARFLEGLRCTGDRRAAHDRGVSSRSGRCMARCGRRCSSRRSVAVVALNRAGAGERRRRGSRRPAIGATARYGFRLRGVARRRRASTSSTRAPTFDRAARPHHAAGRLDGRGGRRRRFRPRRLAGLLRHQQRARAASTACTATRATARSATSPPAAGRRRRESPRHRRVDGRGLGRLRQRRLRGPVPLQVRPPGAVSQRRRAARSSPVGERAGLPRWVNANSAIWLDYDRDGRLDLFLAGYWPEDVDLWHLKTTRIMPESFEYAEQRRPQVPAPQPRRRHVRGRDGGARHQQPPLDAGRRAPPICSAPAIRICSSPTTTASPSSTPTGAASGSSRSAARPASAARRRAA